MKENDFLRWLQQQPATQGSPLPGSCGSAAGGRVVVGIGDDMAIVRHRGLALLKIDQCLDGVHVDIQKHTVADIGRKAVNRCLSDCAAMACMPSAIMLAVALPKAATETFARELFLACREAAAASACSLVGGDTAIWDQRLAITVAALGELPEGSEPVLRAGAKVGDTLFVSGALGGSLGIDQQGRHLRFAPRIELARKLADALGAGRDGGLHAMMDLSDGLAADLPRLCAASGLGAQVHAAQLPIHPDAFLMAEKDGIPAGFHALVDGEDYELLFAVDPHRVPDLIPISQNLIPLTAIGTITEKPELSLMDSTGQAHPWPKAGWEHTS